MSMPAIKKTVYRGGIRTLRDIKIRCVVKPASEGHHWLWRMTTMHCEGRMPMCSVGGGARMATRRAAWILANRPIGQGEIVYGTCTEILCCNPAHSKAGSRDEAVKHAGASGALCTPKRTAASLRRAKARRRFSDAQIREILRDTRPSIEIARSLGVARQTITAIKRRDMYADVQVGGDVFSIAQAGLFSRLVSEPMRRTT